MSEINCYEQAAINVRQSDNFLKLESVQTEENRDAFK